MCNRIGKVIREYRKKRIEGTLVDLVPFTEKDTADVVLVRNREKNRYFLHQTYRIDADSQMQWYQEYLERDNDIYWCVYDKKDQFMGTVRIYDIDEEKDLCSQGSFIIDEEFSEGAPYALEAEILTLDFAFGILKIGKVANEDRADNKTMNNLSKKLGFTFIKNTKREDTDYKYYLLDPEDYQKNRDKFASVIAYWSVR